MKTRTTTLRLGAVIIAVAAGMLALTSSAGGSISPVADQIAFMSTADGEADIYSMSPSNLSQFNLTHDETTGFREDVEPAWSPSGDLVAFQRDFFLKGTPLGSQLYVVTADGQKLWALASPEKGVFDSHPSWSPDGDSIVFSSDRDGNFELYVIKSSGQGLTQLTHTKLGVGNLEPAWSLDGQSIVFTRQMTTATPSASSLFIYRLDTGLIYKLTQRPLTGRGDREPAWSPDSTQIAFSSDRPGPSTVRSIDLFVVNANGSGLTRMTTTSSNEYHPTWSPYGDQLGFVGDPKGVTEIYALDLPVPASDSPGKIHQLTFDGAYKSNPTWHGLAGFTR